MRLTAEEFLGWVEPFYKERGLKLSWSRVDQDCDVKRVTLAFQRNRNRIDLNAVLSIARSWGLNPIDEIATIPRYSHLTSRKGTSADLEVLASMDQGYVVEELACRALDRKRRLIKTPWNEPPYRYYTWFAYTSQAEGGAYAEPIIKALGLNRNSVSQRLQGRTAIAGDEIIVMAEAVDLNPVLGLVLNGSVTPEEAGYPPRLREEVLQRAETSELVSLIRFSLGIIQKDIIEKAVAAEAIRTLK